MSYEDRDQQMVDAYREGRTLTDIGKEWGLTRERVRQIVKATGETMPREVVHQRALQALDDLIQAGGALSADRAAKARGVSGGAKTLRSADPEKYRAYLALRRRYRDDLHASRVRGEGSVVCTSCGVEKSWADMQLTKTAKGIPTRTARCKDCAAAVVRRHYREKAENYNPRRITRKKCTSCGETKGSRSFYPHKATRDGLASWCKQCYADWRKEI